MSNYRNWLIVLLTIFSVCSIAAHRYGLFEIQLDLLSKDNRSDLFASSSEKVDTVLEEKEDGIVMDCSVKQLESYSFCSITFLLSADGEFEDFLEGRDLTKYQKLNIDIDYDGPSENPNLRISFRNTEPKYLKEGDYTSLKYNSMIFESLNNTTLNQLSLSSFSVESWWLVQHQVEKEDNQVNFENIAFIEILPDIISKVDDYSITINQFTLSGELVSEPTLLIFILVLWLTVVVGLVLQSANNLKKIATTDLLTKVMNRNGISDWVDGALKNGVGKYPLNLFYVNFDDFKRVNDNYGHIVGDELLCELCTRIKQTIECTNFKFHLARLAGDEFVIVFLDMPEHTVNPIATLLVETLSEPVNLSNCSLKMSASIGISSSSADTPTFEALLNLADVAMYFAKEQGKNQYKLYDKAIAKDIYYRKDIAQKIRDTITNGEFHLNFMPIYCCSSKRMVKAEVLLRSGGKYLEGIGPDVFIPIAEEFHLIHDIDLWVIEDTFKTIRQNKDIFLSEGFVFCINISAIELNHEHFPHRLETLIKKYNIPSELIELEITETSLVDTNDKSIAALKKLRSLGLHLSLDDFGTGYTAFNQLINYPVSCLKIDKSFVDGLSDENKTKSTIIKAILAIADSYGLQTVAEGIETEEQLEFMRNHNCDMVQGYLLSKPISLSALIDLRVESLEVAD